MIDVGDVVDDFELPDETGTPRKLRDLPAEFAAAGGQRVGISFDPVDKQQRFSEKHGFDYPLLSDADGKVATMMGVARKKTAKRVTFVIDQDRRVADVVRSEVRMNVHADRALDALKQLQRR